MYAVVEIAGQQFKVEKDQKVYVNRLEGKEGSKISFDNILMLDNSGKVVLGNPVVKGASVEAKIVKHLKDDKVIVFKKKRRKGYKVKNGHRQALTQIVVENILEKGIPTLDIVSSLKLGEHYNIKFKAQNLLNPSFELSREGALNGGNVVLGNYKRGVNLSLGLTYDF